MLSLMPGEEGIMTLIQIPRRSIEKLWRFAAHVYNVMFNGVVCIADNIRAYQFAGEDVHNAFLRWNSAAVVEPLSHHRDGVGALVAFAPLGKQPGAPW